MTLRAFAFAACLAFLAPSCLLVGPAIAENVQIDPAHNTVSCSNCGGSSSTSTNNGTADATTTRVTIASDSTGQVKVANLPTTAATGAGASNASTLRIEPSSTAAADGGYAQEGGNLALIAAGMVAQGSTTSGQTGPLVQCATTTSAPTNTTAKTNPLSCDTTGALRITAPATSPVNVTVNTPPNDVLTGPTAVTGAADVIVNSQGAGSVGLQITGTFTGLSGLVRASVDGTNYFNVPAFNTTSGAAVVPGTAITATGSWFVPAAGWRDVEFHATAVSTGTANVSVNSSAGSIQPLITPSGASAVDVMGVNGATVATGNGVVSTHVQRVAIASDNTPFSVNPQPATSGGLSVKSFIVGANTTSVAVDASAGQIYGITASSISAATPVWMKFYNAAQGSTTCGSGTPVQREMIPAPGASGGGTNIMFPVGIAYSTAITVCVTAGQADADTTNPAATSYIVNVFYK